MVDIQKGKWWNKKVTKVEKREQEKEYSNKELKEK